MIQPVHRWFQADPSKTVSADGWLREYRGVRVLVTGATGFIGRWVWAGLSGAGAEIYAVGRSQASLRTLAREQGLRGQLIAEDLAARGAVAALVEAVRPAVIFNVAGYGVDATERDAKLKDRINAELPAAFAFALADRLYHAWPGQRLIHVGSAFEYGSVPGVVEESTPPHPVNTYALSKLKGTLELSATAQALNLAAVTARVCTIYGPGEHPHRLLPGLLRAARLGTSIDLTWGEQLRDFTYVRDVAEGLLRLGVVRSARPIVNLATGTLTTVREFAESALRAAGGSLSQANFGAIAYRPDEVWQGRVSVALCRSLLGWTPPTTIEQGIAATCEFAFAQSSLSP